MSGDVLQFSGQAWEGKDPGKVILVTKVRGVPFVEVAPLKHREAASISNKFATSGDDRPNDQ
ncbi:MAG: hypothetical protein C0478_03840 [Planctomyces sp.]|nr:hypothetical protein [Planctomyces sp.]